ncbi:MAG: 2-hydroxyglutaryl-CoA dehydratase [Clostridiales bacterium]|nr:2-hydroxyglutaryl-CoA dehydratase [Clostridiales bacterium]
MKKTHTILMPNMLPMHEKLMEKIFASYGYRVKLLKNSGRGVVEKGQKFVHNDTCYPALLVIGQFIDAIENEGYDPDKTAVLITQTGGGCRASNYIHLLRKALRKAGYGQVPVISFNMSGLEKDTGFKLTLPLVHRLLYAVMYGDLLMLLRNQTKPYEVVPGTSETLCDTWVKRLTDEMQSTSIHYRRILANYRAIIDDFARIERQGDRRVRVGIVGEIFVKYSPLGNNDLEAFLMHEGAEVVVPGLADFCLYCVYNNMMDSTLYGKWKYRGALARIAMRFLLKKQKDIISLIQEEGSFDPPTPFDHTLTLGTAFVGHGTKMGEGWLLTAEMVELYEQGVKNIVCAQPFGCLPNHIVGKGVMKPLKEKFPDINIVAIDYDPGATRINQENRLKLMLSNAQA